MNILVPVLLGLLIGAAPAQAAVEQCRFIQAKAEREACYQRQAAALAAKRKPEPTGDTKTMESLQQMRREDDAVYQSLRSICRVAERLHKNYALPLAHFAARFSANEARPSEASDVWRFAACIRTRRA